MLTRIACCACLLSLWWACTPDEEIFRELEDESLFFSTDTLHFDTLLTTRLSPSYRVFLHNRSKNGVVIPSLRMRDNNSPYSLTVNGLTAKQFSDVKILGNDSLLILVKAALPPSQQDSPLLVRDYLEMAGDSNQPFLVVEGWGQDASFVQDLVISGEEVWNSPVPYVVKGAVLVDTLSKLTIEAGVTVIMEPNANFYVKGCLITEGAPDKQVVFRNVRTDARYKEAPGQWGAIYFLEGSNCNFLNHTLIKNGEIGLRIGTPDDDELPDLTIANCVIGNMSSDGILAFTSDVYAYNTVVYNAGRYLAGNIAGGNYRYEHCTFSNFPNDFFRKDPSVVFYDYVVLADNSVLTAPLSASVFNSVVWGTQASEIEVAIEGKAGFVLQFGNNLLKSANSLFEANSNVLNVAPQFENELLYDYRPDSLSPLINAGINRNIQFDLLGNPRDSVPDIGAYEWKPTQEGEN